MGCGASTSGSGEQEAPIKSKERFEPPGPHLLPPPKDKLPAFGRYTWTVKYEDDISDGIKTTTWNYTITRANGSTYEFQTVKQKKMEAPDASAALAAAEAANVAAPLNVAMLKWCIEAYGTQVGDGQCSTLAEKSLKAIGAAPPDYDWENGFKFGEEVQVPGPISWTMKNQDPTLSYRMSDPEGDQGQYTGPGDKDGKAHGRGQMKYDDGMVFSGEFTHGCMTRGAVWKGSRATFTMVQGKWTDQLDSAIVAEFPHHEDSPVKNMEPGDILQFKWCKFKGPLAGGSFYESHAGDEHADGNHTAVVFDVDHATRQVVCLEQNVGGNLFVTHQTYRLNDMYEGTVKAYRAIDSELPGA